MIVIGADTHKSTHTLAAVDAATGRVVATKTVSAKREGMLAAWRWAHGSMTSACGRSRTAGTCPVAWSAAWSARASGVVRVRAEADGPEPPRRASAGQVR